MPDQNAFALKLLYMLPIRKVMEFINKIENLLNMLLTKLGSLLITCMPVKIRNFFVRWMLRKQQFMVWSKALPFRVVQFSIARFHAIKEILKTIDYKAKLQATFQTSLTRYKIDQPKELGKIKIIFLTPFLMFSQWLQGLSIGQSMILLGFSAASVLAGINMIFSGQRMLKPSYDDSRTPASTIEEVSYARPEYYKKQTRHFTLTSLRLPIYIPEVNEIRSVDVDFTATLSTREAKIFLEKREFELRDHLINEIEPSIASFPLEEEGKEIIRRKIDFELNQFLTDKKIKGEVKELKITYLLAN